MRKPLLLILPFLTSCSSPPETDFNSPVPRSRLNAILRAARDNDKSSIPKLIKFLNSDDPVVRMASIRTLEQLTGTTRGYDYAAPEYQRREQIQAWVDWYNRQNPPQSPSPPAPAAPPAAP